MLQGSHGTGIIGGPSDLPSMYVSSGDLNVSPCACVLSIFLADPSPPLSNHSF